MGFEKFDFFYPGCPLGCPLGNPDSPSVFLNCRFTSDCRSWLINPFEVGFEECCECVWLLSTTLSLS